MFKKLGAILGISSSCENYAETIINDGADDYRPVVTREEAMMKKKSVKAKKAAKKARRRNRR